MHLHMVMLYDMVFHNCECPLKNMVFSNFWQKIGTTNSYASFLLMPVETAKI